MKIPTRCKFCGKVLGGGHYYTGPGGVSEAHCWNEDCSEKGETDHFMRKEEEIREMRINNQCIYNEPYRGYCKEEGHPFCEEHAKEKCHRCGDQATHGCPNAGMLVCGMPLCDRCVCLRHGG